MIKGFSTSSFVAGFILGVLAVGAYFIATNQALLPMPSQLESTATTTEATSTSGAVAVSDQVAGAQVIIDSVTVPPPGVWIAVRELDGTDLGNVLGAVRVGGPRTSVAIPLLRATEAGHQYAVELYRDDNNGAFDPTLNSVYVDFDTGERVVVYFNTTN